MLKQISRLPNRRGLASIAQLLPGQWSRPAGRLQINEDAPTKLATLRFAHSQIQSDSDATAAGPAAGSASTINDLTEDVNNCQNVQVLLDIIWPYVSGGRKAELSTGQVMGICNRLNELQMLDSPKNYQSNAPSLKEHYERGDRYTKSLRSFLRVIRSSISLRLFLERAGQLVNNESDKNFLIALLQTLGRIQESPDSPIVQKVMLELNKKVEDLDAAGLAECLITMTHYLNNPCSTGDFYKFNLKLLAVAKRRILLDEFDLSDVNLASQYLLIFLRTENRSDFRVTEHLVNRLLSPSLRSTITFENYLHIMHKIAQSDVLSYLASNWLGLKEGRSSSDGHYKLRRAYQVNSVGWQSKRTLGQCLFALIDRCNEEIYQGLSDQPTDEQFNVSLTGYLLMFKHRAMRFLYTPIVSQSEKIVRLAATRLRQQEFDPETHGRLLDDAVANSINFFFHPHEDSLARLFYEHFCADETQTSQINASRAYIKLSKYRYDFVDHRRLASKLIGSVGPLGHQFEGFDCLQVLSRLVLNDAGDEQLFDQIGALVQQLDAGANHMQARPQYMHMALANAYLQTPFCKLDGHLRTKAQRILTDMLEVIWSLDKHPKVDLDYYRNDIQANGYLSNGIFLNELAIFDRSAGNLIPLNEYARYFRRVDLIPLKDGQQLLTFSRSPHLKDRNSTNLYNYQLEKILATFNIKLILIDLGDLRASLLRNDAPHFHDLLAAKALKELKSNS